MTCCRSAVPPWPARLPGRSVPGGRTRSCPHPSRIQVSSWGQDWKLLSSYQNTGQFWGGRAVRFITHTSKYIAFYHHCRSGLGSAKIRINLSSESLKIIRSISAERLVFHLKFFSSLFKFHKRFSRLKVLIIDEIFSCVGKVSEPQDQRVSPAFLTWLRVRCS